MTKKQAEEVVKRIDEMYNEVDERLDNIEKVLILQEENLKIHLKRSDNLETLIDRLKENDIKPISKHVAMVEGAAKLIGIAAVGVSIVSGIFSFFR